MHNTWCCLLIYFIFAPILSATLPLTPVSASSKIIVSTELEDKDNILIANIILDISPPEATLFNGFNVCPAFVEIKNSTLSCPFFWKSTNLKSTLKTTLSKYKDFNSFVTNSVNSLAFDCLNLVICSAIDLVSW